MTSLTNKIRGKSIILHNYLSFSWLLFLPASSLFQSKMDKCGGTEVVVTKR